jgi:hypothetical protein
MNFVRTFSMVQFILLASIWTDVYSIVRFIVMANEMVEPLWQKKKDELLSGEWGGELHLLVSPSSRLFLPIASFFSLLPTLRAVKRLKRWRNSAVSLTVSFNKRNRKPFCLINETENRFVNRFVYHEMERNTKFRVFYIEILLTKWKIPFCSLREIENSFVNRFV